MPSSKHSHCIHGHPFDEKNTYTDKTGHRYCRRCLCARAMKRRQRPEVRDRRNENRRRNYAARPEVRQQFVEKNSLRMQSKKALIAAAKQACSRCPESHPACLDFHHRDPETKSFALSRGHEHSRAAILAEIAKCDVLCANCHRKEHTSPQRTHQSEVPLIQRRTKSESI